ncbi:MAG: LysE family translocator [Gammaproteobacteria bacterium]|nr:LysE family translocator [Gammaproteobacteria bacterium]
MILDPSLTAAYVVLATALALSPGPDVLFVIANGIQHRSRGAIASALGICAGSIVHALAAAVGVSAVIAASPIAFDVLRYGGATYLAYLGVKAIIQWYTNKQSVNENSGPIAETSAREVFVRGLVTNILNPKVVVFYFALLPQFVDTDLGQVGLQIFLLGCIHNVIGLVFLICIGLAAGRASGWLARTSMGRWLDGIAGVFFIGLAIRLVLF